MGEFVAGIDGIARAARELGVPFVSGNVSLYNQSSTGRAVPASPIIACVGAIADISRSATMGFKRVGSVIYRLGAVPSSLGGSVAAELLDDAELAGAPLPAIDYAALRNEIAALLAAHARGLVLAAHDVSDGGTLVALAEMGFAAHSEIGVLVDADLPLRAAFGEASSFLIETAQAAALEVLCAEFGAELTRIGATIAEPTLRGKHGLHMALRDLHDAWAAPLRDFYADIPEQTT
jgi:phosphoribosylformylglycinamidine synthase